MLDPICRIRPEWLPASAWHMHGPFAALLMAQLRPGTVVELGTHRGYSICMMAQAAKRLGLSSRLYAVDTWEGDPHAGHYTSSIHDDLAAHVQAKHATQLEMLRMTFDKARDRFADGSIDLLHIDGLHTYEAVAHDYNTWKSKVSPDGVILFHDTAEVRPGFGVYQLWAELEAAYPGQTFNFPFEHGLGVLAFGRSREVLAWLLDRNAPSHAETVESLELFGLAIKGSFQMPYLQSVLKRREEELGREIDFWQRLCPLYWLKLLLPVSFRQKVRGGLKLHRYRDVE